MARPSARDRPMAQSLDPAYFDEVTQRDAGMDAAAVVDTVFRRVSKLRPYKAGDRAVDIGCGTGVITSAVVALGLDASGVDVVPEFVEVARERVPDATFAAGPAEKLPFADEQFDYVILLSLLEHVEDWEQTLAEATRVLKPGGVMYLTTTNKYCPKQYEIRYLWGFGYLPGWTQRRIYAWAMEHKPSLVNYTHLPAYHWFSYGQLASHLRRRGLEPHHLFELLGEEEVAARYDNGVVRQAVGFMLRHPFPWSYLIQPTTTVVALKPNGLSNPDAAPG